MLTCCCSVVCSVLPSVCRALLDTPPMVSWVQQLRCSAVSMFQGPHTLLRRARHAFSQFVFVPMATLRTRCTPGAWKVSPRSQHNLKSCLLNLWVITDKSLLAAATAVIAAVVPPGYFLKSPGQVAPCPQGEWKSGPGTAANVSGGV
jgi:hypothetical protein